jgi:hypothetical protein
MPMSAVLPSMLLLLLMMMPYTSCAQITTAEAPNAHSNVATRTPVGDVMLTVPTISYTVLTDTAQFYGTERFRSLFLGAMTGDGIIAVSGIPNFALLRREVLIDSQVCTILCNRPWLDFYFAASGTATEIARGYLGRKLGRYNLRPAEGETFGGPGHRSIQGEN